jgi:hypothetical protein
MIIFPLSSVENSSNPVEKPKFLWKTQRLMGCLSRQLPGAFPNNRTSFGSLTAGKFFLNCPTFFARNSGNWIENLRVQPELICELD